MLWAHMREHPPPLTEVRPELPGAVDLVIARSIDKDPAERYATARDLVDELQSALEGVPDAKTRVPKPRPAQPAAADAPAPAEDRPRRRRALPAIVALVSLLLGAALGAAALAFLRDDEPEPVTVVTRPPPPDGELLALIPPSVKPTCKASDRLTLDFEASILCTVGSADVHRVAYHDAESAAKMADHFKRRILGEGILPLGRAIQPREHCGSPPALQEWRRTSTGGHEPVQEGERARGRVICYRRNGWAAVEWTDQDSDVYGVAYGPDLIRLFRWWKGQAGPLLPAD